MGKSLFDLCGVEDEDRFLIKDGEMRYRNGYGWSLEDSPPEKREGFVLRKVEELDSTYIEEHGVLVQLEMLYAYCCVAHENTVLKENKAFFHDALQRLRLLMGDESGILFLKHFGLKIEKRGDNYHIADTGEVATPADVLARVEPDTDWSDSDASAFGLLFPEFFDPNYDSVKHFTTK